MKNQKYVLFVDSDCDVSLKEAQEKGVGFISMPYMVDDKEIYPYKDWEHFDYHAFYEMLRKGTLPKTSGISPAAYMELFEPAFKEGKDILYIHFSAAMSGTFNALDLALEELKEKYPERRLERVDTKGISALSYCIFMEVYRQYEEGKSMEEILKWAETEVDHYACYFYADDLKFFGKSGRVSGFSSFMGNLIGIRPLITVNEEGKMVSCDKAVGRNTAVKKVLGYVEQLQDEIAKHPVYIAHSDCLHLAERAAEELKKRYGEDLDIHYCVVNPTIGSHCGPDCVGVCFHAKKR